MDTKLVKLFYKMIEDRKNCYNKLAMTCSEEKHQVTYRSVSTAYADTLEMLKYLMANDEVNLKNFDYFGEEEEED